MSLEEEIIIILPITHDLNKEINNPRNSNGIGNIQDFVLII